MKTLHLAAILLASSAIACSSSSGGSGDGGAPVDASEDVASKCGHPGDVGNSLGVGKFCEHISDCADTKSAHLCSVIGDLTTHFCLMTCTPPADGGVDGGDAAAPDAAPADQCGENATCECGSGGCGCTPNACL